MGKSAEKNTTEDTLNLRNLNNKILKKSRGRGRGENLNEKQCEAERNRARDNTLIYNSQLSGFVFLLNIQMQTLLKLHLKRISKT